MRESAITFGNLAAGVFPRERERERKDHPTLLQRKSEKAATENFSGFLGLLSHRVEYILGGKSWINKRSIWLAAFLSQCRLTG